MVASVAPWRNSRSGFWAFPFFSFRSSSPKWPGGRSPSGLPGGLGAAVTETSTEIPFSLSYKPAHPFLAEYDKAVVFPSGKTIGLAPDSGGGGPDPLLADASFHAP